MQDLKLAIAQNEFKIMIQPQVDLFTHELIGGEVLVRWAHHQRGIVSPVEFIELAEQTGLIVQITQIVIDSSFNWLAEQTQLPNDFSLSINLSTHDLDNDHLMEFIINKLEEYRILPEQITFEVTESSVMNNTQLVQSNLAALKEKGFSLAIDDFGTGYSSLSQFQKIHADKIKIDLSFIRGINQNKTNQAITRTITQLADSINAKTIAEGIENGDELYFVKNLKCHYGQGYFWSQPLDLIDFERRFIQKVNPSYY